MHTLRNHQKPRAMARLSLLGEILKQRVQLEVDILRYVLHAFALYLAITGGLLKFSLDASATPLLRTALIFLGIGLSSLGLAACALAIVIGNNMKASSAKLAETLKLDGNPATYLPMRVLAFLIGGFVGMVLFGWFYLWLSGVGPT